MQPRVAGFPAAGALRNDAATRPFRHSASQTLSASPSSTRGLPWGGWCRWGCMADVGSSPARSELLRRRYAKGGWLAVAAGVVIPFLAFGGAYRGFRLWRAG